jgi:hypothetical protein
MRSQYPELGRRYLVAEPIVPDAPDADLQDQRQTVVPDSGGGIDIRAVTRDIEAPEADAIEQAQAVPLPDDEHDDG